MSLVSGTREYRVSEAFSDSGVLVLCSLRFGSRVAQRKKLHLQVPKVYYLLLVTATPRLSAATL